MTAHKETFNIGDKVIYQRKLKDEYIGYAYEGTIANILKNNRYEIKIVDGYKSAILAVDKEELRKGV